MWNVLIGDMSVVGPRPLLMRYVPRYSPFQTRRMEVKPGVTGWAQVNGRDEIPLDLKVKYDQEYLEQKSFLMDLKILLMTVWKVLRLEDVVH